MSGFLDQLIARSLGSGEFIRPRARLLFEPQLADNATLKPATFGNAEFEEVATAPDAPMLLPGRETVERNDRESARAQGETVATRLSPSALVEPCNIASGIRPGQVKVEDAPRLSPAVNADNRAARAVFNEAAPPHQAEVGLSATPPPPPRENDSAASVLRSRASEVAHDSIVSLRTADTPSHSIDPPAARGVLSQQPPLAPPRASVEATRSTEQPPLVLPRASVESTRSREQSRVASPLDQRRPADLRRPADREPTIHVTIGRIEVRAEQPSSRPPAKEGSTQKPMSLDEYLRRRAGRSGE
jgi:hypothetical protein